MFKDLFLLIIQIIDFFLKSIKHFLLHNNVYLYLFYQLKTILLDSIQKSIHLHKNFYFYLIYLKLKYLLEILI